MWKEVGDNHHYIYNNKSICIIMKDPNSTMLKTWMCFITSLDKNKVWSDIFLDHSKNIEILKLEILLKAKSYGWNIKTI